MKKLFSLFLFFCMFFNFNLASYAAKSNLNYTQRINKIGRTILKKNNLPHNIEFKLIKKNKVNAYANMYNKIYVYSGLVKYTENDDELAAVISHEIGHIVNSHVIKLFTAGSVASAAINAGYEYYPAVAFGADLLYRVSSKKWSRSDEFEADITGVDLMIRAGYNPLAMISFLNRVSSRYPDFISTHPSGEKRTLYIYKYILYTYPEIASKGYNSQSYQEFMQYCKPIIEEIYNNPEKQAAFNRTQEKLKQKRQEKYTKYTKKKKKSHPNYTYGQSL